MATRLKPSASTLIEGGGAGSPEMCLYSMVRRVRGREEQRESGGGRGWRKRKKEGGAVRLANTLHNKVKCINKGMVLYTTLA